MFSFRQIGLLGVLMATSVTVLAAAPNFKDGEWGTRYRMEVVGAPFPMPPITVRRSTCLTRDNYIPDNSQQGQDCKISDQKVDGNTVSWTMRCKTPQGNIDGHGKITYQGERYSGVMESRMTSAEGAAMPMTYRYTMEGERLGACSK